VPGANLEKVQSRLEDPAEFGGQHVLVVGGGDSAVEAAASLVDAGATVTLSYRGDGFKRCKQGNQKRLAELSSAGRLSVLLESNVKEFTPDAVAIKLKDGRVVTLPNQQAFVLIGADTPVAWLEANHVRFVEREHLYALGSTEDAVLKVVPGAAECPRSPDEAIAVLDGAPLRPSHRRERAASHRPGAERSVVGRLRDELHRAAGELTGVFIPASQLARPRPPTPAPRLFARPTTVRPRTSPGPAAPSETTVEMMSLPARLEARPAGAPRSTPRSTPRPRTELHPWSEDDHVVTSAPAYPSRRAAARAAPTYESGPVTVIDGPTYAPDAPAQVLRKRMAG
jgi:Pyridine nucleotide-disulphide oxidoreductase